MGVDFLGAIPLEQHIMEIEDRGESVFQEKPESPSVKALEGVVEKILKKTRG